MGREAGHVHGPRTARPRRTPVNLRRTPRAVIAANNLLITEQLSRFDPVGMNSAKSSGRFHARGQPSWQR
jgi:hypothetical protein